MGPEFSQWSAAGAEAGEWGGPDLPPVLSLSSLPHSGVAS